MKIFDSSFLNTSNAKIFNVIVGTDNPDLFQTKIVISEHFEEILSSAVEELEKIRNDEEVSFPQWIERLESYSYSVGYILTEKLKHIKFESILLRYTAVNSSYILTVEIK